MTTNQPGSAQPSSTSTGTPSSPAEAKDLAQQAAGTAADEARNVAGTAQSEAVKVAQEATDQVRGLLDEALSQADDQARTQLDRLVGVLGSVGDDLETMSGQVDGGVAADLTGQVATRVRSLTTHLDGREPRDLIEDVRGFARRRPGTFLAGALVAGLVVGRVTRGARDATPATTPAKAPVTTPTVPTQPVAPESVTPLPVSDPADDALLATGLPAEPAPAGRLV